MKNEPAIGNKAFIQAIQQGYGFDIVSLEFLLRGWGGDCYVAKTDKGQRYFLKVHDDATYMGIAVTSRKFYLPLMDNLFTKGILTHIPHPIATLDGELSLSVGSNELVLTNFIEAKLVGFDHLSDKILTQLAEAVGILHRSKSQIEIPHPFIEQFEITFEADLLKSFDALEAITTGDRKGKQLLRDILLPRKNEVVASLHRLKELQLYTKSTNKPMVICHTDLHGGNLMTDAQGRLYILDWENAMIAPPEHDMIFFAGEAKFWDVFWPHYTRQFSQPSLDSEVLGFYYYRRGLEDVAGFVLRILQGDGSEARDREDINWLVGNLNELAEIDNTIADIEKKFRSQ